MAWHDTGTSELDGTGQPRILTADQGRAAYNLYITPYNVNRDLKTTVLNVQFNFCDCSGITV